MPQHSLYCAHMANPLFHRNPDQQPLDRLHQLLSPSSLDFKDYKNNSLSGAGQTSPMATIRTGRLLRQVTPFFGEEDGIATFR